MTVCVINKGKFETYKEAVKEQKKLNLGFIFSHDTFFTIRVATFFNKEEAERAIRKMPDEFWLEVITKDK